MAHYQEQRNTVALVVTAALGWLHAGLTEQSWSGVKTPEELVDIVIDEFILCMVGDTLVACSVTRPWFLNCPVLSEEFVAPVGPEPASMHEVVAALEAIGRATGCKRLTLGTRANPRQEGLARLFRATGCTLSTMELTKEIAHVQGS